MIDNSGTEPKVQRKHNSESARLLNGCMPWPFRGYALNVEDYNSGGKSGKAISISENSE